MKKLLFLFALLPTLLFSQHHIKGMFSPPENFTYALLYQSQPSSLNYFDRSKVEADGSFDILLDSTATPGMYKLVYGLPQGENNFDLIYSGKEDVFLTFSLDDGLVFSESNENKLWASYTKSMELVNMAISNFYTQESTDAAAFNDIFKTLKETQEAFESASKGTMASTFIKANRPYIPKSYEDVSTYSKSLKENFLKNIDFSDKLLQSSDFLADRVLAYVISMSAANDTVTFKQHITDVVNAIGDKNTIVKTALLELIWQKMVEMELPEVANYISDTYLLELAKETNNLELSKTLLTYKNNADGVMAQDFAISYIQNGTMVNTTLHELSGAENYLLIFWSSNCSHCLNELPQVEKYLEEYPKNMKVIAFGLEEEKEHWQKTISKFPNFIHVLGLEHWDNPVGKAYGVTSTPTYFILDKNKKIVSKPHDVDALKVALEGLK